MNFSHCRTYSESLSEYGRGVAGGLIFSLPLLFTMEVWQASFLVSPRRLIAYMIVTYGLLILYNRFAGLRKEASWLECAIDSVEEMGLGIVLAALVLWLFGRFDGAGFEEIVANTLMEGMTVAIGVSVGTAQLGTSESNEENVGEGDTTGTTFISQMAIALCGGVLFVSSVAPTEEILVVAIGSSPLRLLMIALISMIVGSYLLFFTELKGSSRFANIRKPIFLARGAICTYAVALFASALTLFFFGRFDGQGIHTVIGQTVVAGVPAALGASAGRLLLQVNSNGN